MANEDTPREQPENAGMNADSPNEGTLRTTPDSEQNTPISQNPMTLYTARRVAEPDERVGQCLRHVREALGLDIDALGKELIYSRGYLMAIERMEVGTIPSGYLTKYLRGYARRLGLTADTVVEDYTRDCGAIATVSAPTTITTPNSAQTASWRAPAIAAVAVLGVVLGGASILMQDDALPAADNTSIVAEPVNGARESLFANAPLPERIEVETLPLSLAAVKDGWIEVRGADGTIFRSRVMHAGETYMPRLGAGWTISARDGSAFEWRVGDAIVGPLGAESAAVYAASVDAAATRAIEVATPALAAAGNGTPSR